MCMYIETKTAKICYQFCVHVEISNISTALNQGYLELEDGWISPLNGFQYKRTFINQSWSENRNICQSWGGDLASHGIQDFYTRK